MRRDRSDIDDRRKIGSAQGGKGGLHEQERRLDVGIHDAVVFSRRDGFKGL